MGGYRQVSNAKKPSIASRNNSSSAENYYLFFKTLPVGYDTIELKMVGHATMQPNYWWLVQ